MRHGYELAVSIDRVQHSSSRVATCQLKRYFAYHGARLTRTRAVFRYIRITLHTLHTYLELARTTLDLRVRIEVRHVCYNVVTYVAHVSLIDADSPTTTPTETTPDHPMRSIC